MPIIVVPIYRKLYNMMIATRRLRSRIVSIFSCVRFSTEAVPAAAPLAAAAATVAPPAPAAAAAAPAPSAPPTLPPFKWAAQLPAYKQLGFIANDPSPQRPPEDDIAVVTAYYELMASAWASKDPKAQEEVLRRSSRLKRPSNWVALLRMFASRKQVAPALLASLEPRFLADEAAPLGTLDADNLDALAWAASFHGGAADAPFSTAIAAAKAKAATAPAPAKEA